MDVDEVREELRARHKARVEDEKETDRRWKEIKDRQFEDNRQWEILKKLVPGYEDPITRRRREWQAGYERWARDIWRKDYGLEWPSKPEEEEKKSWDEILDELEDFIVS